MEPVQWLTGLYNFRIMNLFDILHFGHGKNYVKQLVSQVHGDIIWMDRMVQLDVELISKITGLHILGAQPKEYLDNKVGEKEIVELVKGQLSTIRGNKGIVLKDINGNVTIFKRNSMSCKMLRKIRKEETPTGLIAVVA
jgi:hypothetical protein